MWTRILFLHIFRNIVSDNCGKTGRGDDAAWKSQDVSVGYEREDVFAC